MPAWSGSASGQGADQIFFGSSANALTAPQLSQIRFADPLGFAAGTYAGKFLATGELVVAIPEPGSVALLLSGAGTLLLLRRRRR